MLKDSPYLGSADITVKNDPRVLPLGRILRKTMTQSGFSTIDSGWWHFDAFPHNLTKTKYSIIENIGDYYQIN